MPDLTPFVNFGLPTVLLMVILFGIAWATRQSTVAMGVAWEYLTGSGSTMITDKGIQRTERLGVITQIKDAHVQFLSSTQATLTSQSHSLERMAEGNEAIVGLLQQMENQYELIGQRLSALERTDLHHKVMETATSAMRDIAKKEGSDTVMLKADEMAELLKQDKGHHS